MNLTGNSTVEMLNLFQFLDHVQPVKFVCFQEKVLAIKKIIFR